MSPTLSPSALLVEERPFRGDLGRLCLAFHIPLRLAALAVLEERLARRANMRPLGHLEGLLRPQNEGEA